MALDYIAKFSIDGKPQNMPMQYEEKDIITTLTRRIKTAFPNAVSINITRDEQQLPLSAGKNK